MIDEKKVKLTADFIKESKKVVVFTGAGISCASNIPDFRSSNGLYNQSSGTVYRPEEIISRTFFDTKPDVFYKFYKEKMVYQDALPNIAHRFFADLQEKKDVSVVTQNIDGLHQKAGSKKVYELHGSIWRNYCKHCGRFFTLEEIMAKDTVPRCDACGGIIKPDVVLYEEALDDKVIEGALRAITTADLMFVIGTSLTVYPAASFVNYYYGNKLVLINKDKTQYDGRANVVFNDDITEVIRELSKYSY